MSQLPPTDHIETLCLQAGWRPGNGEPHVLPIYQSTTFHYDSSEQMARLFDLAESGFFYTRLGNPTLDYVEKKIAALEGGIGAMLTSSGQAASFLSVFNLLGAGDHLVASSAIYGGTFNLVAVTMKRMGIETTFVEPSASADEIAAAFRPNTRALFAESVTNPSLEVADFDKLASVAHAHGVPLIIDNTFPTPALCRPFEHGADIVVHSTTKYMDGHAQTTGGVIVDSGRFDWKASGKFPGLTEPDPSYHGLVYTDAFGPSAYIVKARAQLMRDLGTAQTPLAAYVLNLGLETLPLRMERHVRNALAVAEFLENHPRVTWVNHPGLPSSPYHALAQKYMPRGTCGVVSFGVKGGRAAATKLMDSMRLGAILTHVADARTCLLHPASTTHRQLTDDQLAAAGIPPDLIRLSVGLEHIDDILADLTQALEKSAQ